MDTQAAGGLGAWFSGTVELARAPGGWLASESHFSELGTETLGGRESCYVRIYIVAKLRTLDSRHQILAPFSFPLPGPSSSALIPSLLRRQKESDS